MPDHHVPTDIPGRVPVDEVTRVVVITDAGVKEFWADEWNAYLQDDGRTLKLFPVGDGHAARVQAQRALNEQMLEDFRRAQVNGSQATKGTP